MKGYFEKSSAEWAGAFAAVLNGLQQVTNGQDREAVAETIWPAFRRAVGLAMSELHEQEAAGVQRWREARHGKKT